MKTELGKYKDRGRWYHVASCTNCGATASMTTAAWYAMLSPNSLHYLDGNVPCCPRPSYLHFLELDEA